MRIPSHASLLKQALPKSHGFRFHFFCLRIPLLLILILLFATSVFAEQMVVLMYVNSEKKGEVFVHRNDNGDFLLRIEDLKNAGFREPVGAIIQKDGEPHLSLRSMPGISFTFDDQKLILHIKAEPSLLSQTQIEFAGQSAKNVYYPQESSLFLNYGTDYRAGDGFSFQSFNLTNELGVRHGDYLFLADTIYSKDTLQDKFIRLHTSITRDDRQQMHRATFGDLVASSGALGSNVNLGGIGFSKVYAIDPYFVTYPTFQFTGLASLPSEVDIYVNGAKVRTEHISPGEFQLRDLASYGGAGTVDLVVRDSLGREQRYRYPFYAADNILLKKGLHDFSYNIGVLREQFGIASDRYSKPAIVVFHRYGFSDFITLGFRGESTKDVINGGPQGALRLGTAGVLNLSLSGSAGSGAGLATDTSYQYQSRQFNARVFYQYFSREYRMIEPIAMGAQQNYATGIDLGYTYPKFGSLSFDFTTQKIYMGAEKRTATFGYSKDFPGNITLNATFSMAHDSIAGHSNDFFVGLTYTPKADYSFSARHESATGRETESIQAQKNPPLGEGVGFRALLERDKNSGQPDSYIVDPMLQYNGRHAIWRGEMTANQVNGRWSEQYDLNFSGALVALNGVIGLSRPVTDSFSVVKVGEIEGVMVRSSGQDIGRTDSNGRVFLTNINSYNDNMIAINDKDIPFDYYFPQAQRFVSPPLRSGSCIGFAVKKLQPITGILKIKIDGEIKPVEFYEANLMVNGREVPFPTGAGGEFYIDLSQSDESKKLAKAEEKNCASRVEGSSEFLKPDTYQATVMYDGKRHSFTLAIPKSSDPMIDLGTVIISD